MAIIHKAISLNSSANLNFDVVGGTTEPTNPKENTIWVNTSTPIHYWSLNGKEPYKKSNNKNLFTYPYVDTTKTVNGITFTDNGDGSITINGTSTGQAEFILNRLLLNKGTTYALRGTGQAYVGVHIAEYRPDSWVQTPHASDVGDISFTYAGLQDNTANLKCVIYIGSSGRTFNNVVVYPQLEKGSTCTNFVKGDATGQVWVQTLNSNGLASFNALKKNTINTHISSKVFQWNGSTWTRTTGALYQNGTTLPILIEKVLANLSGWVASGGSPGNSGTHWREVTSDGSWDLSDVNTIQSISGAAGTPLEYWQGGDYSDGTKYIFLVFADGTTKEIASWNYTKNYYESDYYTAWSAANIDISSYTTAQKKTVKLKYGVSINVRSTYGSYWTELTFDTSSVIVV